MSAYPDGVDFSTFWNKDGTADLDPNFTPIEGALSVVERFARRLIARLGDYDNPDVGVDVDSYSNEMMAQGRLQYLSTKIREQALQEEGISECLIQGIQNTDGRVNLPCTLTLADKSTWDMVFTLGPDTIPRITLLSPNNF